MANATLKPLVTTRALNLLVHLKCLMSKLHALSKVPKGTALRSLTVSNKHKISCVLINISSSQFKGTTPGSLERLLAPRNASIRDAIVDASHPWSQRHPNSYFNEFPRYDHPHLKITLLPKALLGRPDPIQISNRYLPRNEPNGDAQIQTMSIKFSLSSKEIRSAVHRTQVKNKIKTAISLIATRGANVNGEIVFDEEDSVREWVLEGKSTFLRHVIHNQLLLQTGLILFKPSRNSFACHIWC